MNALKIVLDYALDQNVNCLVGEVDYQSSTENASSLEYFTF